MSPGPTFDRIYRSLKERLLSGAFAPGEPLEPAHLGEDLASSITPVRDALHRLVGERLVEAPQNNGFRAPLLLESDLRDLYSWNGALLALALSARGRHAEAAPHASTAEDGPGGTGNAAELFHRIAQRSGSREHVAAVAGLNDRLSTFRLAETRVLDGAEEDLLEIAAAFSDGEAVLLRRLLSRYHQRRIRAVPDLLDHLRTNRDCR